MITSMTGFGSAEEVTELGTFSVEIRSLNHRFKELSTRLPKELCDLESKIENLIYQYVKRGYVKFSLTWNRNFSSSETLSLNQNVVDTYYAVFEDLKRKYSLAGEIDLKLLAGLPEIFKKDEEKFVAEEIWSTVEKVVTKALTDLVEMRLAEGKGTYDDLRIRLKTIDDSIDKIEEVAPLRLEKAKERIQEKISSLLTQPDLDETRVMMEIVLLADKWDISEEITRLRSHIKLFSDSIENGGVVGRKLTFLLQEMNREINTIAAKANDADIAHYVITTKDELEKLREQCENIE